MPCRCARSYVAANVHKFHGCWGGPSASDNCDVPAIPIFSYVYRPTMFVIWGGNAEGIAVGGRYNFWGSQWHKQVTGGAYTGDASFKGHAFSVSGLSWTGAPGDTLPPPAQMVEYIGVIVATQATLDGVNTVGNVANERQHRPLVLPKGEPPVRECLGRQP